MSQYEPLQRVDTIERRELPQSQPRPDFFMPAMPPLWLMQAIGEWWRAYRLRRQFRRRFLPLLVHDDHMLEDMGHHREDILWASRLPLRADAHRSLARCRAFRKQSEGGLKGS